MRGNNEKEEMGFSLRLSSRRKKFHREEMQGEISERERERERSGWEREKNEERLEERESDQKRE